jgi:molybdenum cofactor biosynthesis protein B
MGTHHHEQRAPSRGAVGCAVVTVSDTRTPETDASGARIRALLEAAGHRVVGQAILPDEPARIREHVLRLLDDPAVEAVIVNGGTGLAPRDTTYEAIAALLEKRLDGFGELFRMLSYQEIGSAAMLSRATAGSARGRIVVSLPGSTAAVELAMDKLLVPELRHMVQLVRG